MLLARFIFSQILTNKILTNKIEAIQNRAARFVTGDYSRYNSVSAMKQRLDWEPLQLRRKVSRVTTMREALAGRLSIPVRKVLSPVQRPLRKSSSISFIPISTNKNCYNCIHSSREQSQTGTPSQLQPSKLRAPKPSSKTYFKYIQSKARTKKHLLSPRQ